MKVKKSNSKGVIYTKYLPLEDTSLVTNGKPANSKSLKTRYAINTVNPNFYSKIKVISPHDEKDGD